MKSERLFLAIGGADPALLERSRRQEPARRQWIAAAACLAVLCAAALLYANRPGPGTPGVTPPEPPAVSQPGTTPGTSVQPSGEAAGGSLQLLSSRQESSPETDFLLYINQENYAGGWEGDAYVIRPVNPAPENLPECSLTVTHLDFALPDAAETAAEAMAEQYAFVSEITEDTAAGRLTFYACDGTDWDDAYADITVADDGEGGAFVLTARCFTEAVEGHGVWFADMVRSFQPMSGSAAGINWMVSLQNSVDILTTAALSDEWTPEAQGLLAENATVSAYGENVLDLVAVARADFTVDDSQAPSSATVSVQHRLGTEESYTYLTMELACQNGQWQAVFIGLEK